MANAGHLGGREVAVENGLPLGIAADTDYPEVSVPLPVGAQVILYTDGVVGACARSGTVRIRIGPRPYPFSPAELIAQTAQSFGQDDEITVLTVTLEAPARLHLILHWSYRGPR